jgi:hypothetical protein
VFDEYRKTSPKAAMIDEILRRATQGTSSKKGTNADRTTTHTVTARTSPIVCGETSSGDSATASRYITVNFSLARHKDGSKEAWERVKINSCEYRHFGFWLMMHRLQFEREMIKALKEWDASADVRESLKEPRMATSIGIAHSAFRIICSMASVIISETEATQFRQFCISHGKSSTENVRVQSFRHRFWQDVISGLNRPACGIKPIFFGEKHLTVKGFAPNDGCSTQILRAYCSSPTGDYEIAHPHAEEGTRVRVLFLDMNSIYDEWTRDLAQRREVVPISLQNLKSEMESEGWYIPPPKKRGKHVQRLRLKNTEPENPNEPNEPKSKPVTCWCISIERNYDPDGTPSDFENPFAEELINALGINNTQAP